MKILLMSTKIIKEEVSLKKKVAYMVDVRSLCIYPYAKLLALLLATIFLIGFGGFAFYEVSESSFPEALWLAWTFIVDRVSTMLRVVFLHKFRRHVETCNDGWACFLSYLN